MINANWKKAQKATFPKNYHWITNHVCPECKVNLMTVGDMECNNACGKCVHDALYEAMLEMDKYPYGF